MRRWRPLQSGLALFAIAGLLGAASGYLFLKESLWIATATPVAVATLAFLFYGARAYFGMLAVAPDLRNHGLGKRLVAVAEAMGTALGCTAMDLQIVNLREELGPWYRSLGYAEVGTAPFGQATRDVKQPCYFIKMSKQLA